MTYSFGWMAALTGGRPASDREQSQYPFSRTYPGGLTVSYEQDPDQAPARGSALVERVECPPTHWREYAEQLDARQRRLFFPGLRHTSCWTRTERVQAASVQAQLGPSSRRPSDQDSVFPIRIGAAGVSPSQLTGA